MHEQITLTNDIMGYAMPVAKEIVPTATHIYTTSTTIGVSSSGKLT